MVVVVLCVGTCDGPTACSCWAIGNGMDVGVGTGCNGPWPGPCTAATCAACAPPGPGATGSGCGASGSFDGDSASSCPTRFACIMGCGKGGSNGVIPELIGYNCCCTNWN